jgi:hypothetical protein
MHIPDGSPITPGSRHLAVGWLDHGQPITRGDVPDGFPEALWQLCISPILLTRGFHECTFCPKAGRIRLYTRNERSAYLGQGEIWVRGVGKTYRAPNLIYHYVADHQYQPPAEFIHAVMRPRTWLKRQFHRLIFHCQ